MVETCSFTLLNSKEEGRLAWMYKDKVDDEEYLLGRRIDSSSLNDPEPTTNGSWHYFYFCVLFLRLSFESIFSKLAMPSLL